MLKLNPLMAETAFASNKAILMSDDTVASFSAMLRGALDDLLDPGATTFVEMFDEAGVMEFPSAPPGGVGRIGGRAEVAAYLAALADAVVIDAIGSPIVHRTVDPQTVVQEFDGQGQSVATWRAYQQRCISIIRTADGKIVHYRDYWNPLVIASMTDDTGNATPPSAEAVRHAR